jgi:hypothetical protein
MENRSQFPIPRRGTGVSVETARHSFSLLKRRSEQERQALCVGARRFGRRRRDWESLHRFDVNRRRFGGLGVRR